MKKNICVKAAKAGDWADADLSSAQPVVFPNLKPTREPVSLRIPGITLDKIRCLANRRGIPYQSLINSWLTERAEQEIKNPCPKGVVLKSGLCKRPKSSSCKW